MSVHRGKADVPVARPEVRVLTQSGHCNGWEAGNWLALFAENFMHEISGVPGTELLQEIGAMELDGTRADAECPSGLLAGGTPNDLSQHNTFFGSQNLMSGERFRHDIQRAI